jgi:hypothetical protein
MTGPVLQIGALATLGYKVQSSGFGNPVAPSAAAGQWVRQLANDLRYDRGIHEIEVGSSSPDPTQYIAPGFARSMGGFDVPLMGRDGINLLAFFLGAGSDGTPDATGLASGLYKHTLVPKLALRYLTLEDQWSALPAAYAADGVTPDGQSYRLDDCALDTLDLSKDNNGWRIRYGVVGGKGSTSISPPTAATFGTPADAMVFQWGHTAAIAMPGSVPLKHLGDFKLSIRRNIQQFQGPSFHATDAYGGPFQVSGSFDVLFATTQARDAYVTNYIGDTEAALTLTIRTDDPATVTTARQVVFDLQNDVHLMSAQKRWQVGQASMMTVNFRLRDSFNQFQARVFNADNVAY